MRISPTSPLPETYLFHRVSRTAWSNFLPDLLHPLCKYLPVLRVYDGFHRSPKYLDLVLVQDPRFLELDSTVETGLTSESEQDAIRPLAFQDL